MISDVYDVAMLGNSRAGKTTYMRAMYGKFQRPHNGFTLKANPDSEHQDLLQDFAKLSDGHYPDLSALRQKYTFTLSHSDDAVIQFNWIDHRGGAMIDKSEVVDAATLKADLKKASAIILFCDAHALASEDDDRIRMDKMCSLLTKALMEEQSTRAIVILLSKVDLIDGFTKEMIEPFEGLCAAIAASEHVKGTIVPVACGQHFFQVEIPALFALHHLVVAGAETEHQAELAHRQRATDWRETAKQRGVWGRIADFISMTPSDVEIAEAFEEKAEIRAKNYTSVLASAKSLNYYLKSICRIRSGQTSETYAAELQQQFQIMRSQLYTSDWS